MESAQPVLTVRSVDQAVDWYCNFLGFTADYLNAESDEENSLNYAVLRNGDARIHLGLEMEMGVLAGHGGCNFVTHHFDRFHEMAVVPTRLSACNSMKSPPEPEPSASKIPTVIY